MQIILDQVIRAIVPATKALLDLKEMDERELDRIREDHEVLARKERSSRRAN